jgi:hypothetical protein
MICKSNDPRRPQQVAEVADVADGKQEYEVCDIICKEVVNGEMYYLVEWTVTLVPEYELVKRRFWWISSRRDSKHNVGKGAGKRRRLSLSKEGEQANVGPRAIGDETEERARSTSEAGVRLTVVRANPYSQRCLH